MFSLYLACVVCHHFVAMFIFAKLKCLAAQAGSQGPIEQLVKGGKGRGKRIKREGKKEEIRKT